MISGAEMVKEFLDLVGIQFPLCMVELSFWHMGDVECIAPYWPSMPVSCSRSCNTGHSRSSINSTHILFCCKQTFYMIPWSWSDWYIRLMQTENRGGGKEKSWGFWFNTKCLWLVGHRLMRVVAGSSLIGWGCNDAGMTHPLFWAGRSLDLLCPRWPLWCRHGSAADVHRRAIRGGGEHSMCLFEWILADYYSALARCVFHFLCSSSVAPHYSCCWTSIQTLVTAVCWH